MWRTVLASSSPARLATLRAAGVVPEVVVSGVDESSDAPNTAARTCQVAQRKGEAVLPQLDGPLATVVIAADTMLDIDGVSYGKPHDQAVARDRLQAMSGSAGVLHTGHYVAVRSASPDAAAPGAQWRHLVRDAATFVRFAQMTNDEIEAYLATGEPLEVAGSFTIDGFGGPFVASIEGDPHNVVGLSLPLMRLMLAELGVGWVSLWASDLGHGSKSDG